MNRELKEAMDNVKIYPNGYKGTYIRRCCECMKYFMGDKRDVICGKCEAYEKHKKSL